MSLTALLEEPVYLEGPEDRNCRWCGGLGLDPFLPSRIRQFFTSRPWFTERSCKCSDPAYCTAKRDVLLPDVNVLDPLNLWVEDYTGEFTGPHVHLTPFDIIGMSYCSVRCQRCRGTGRLPRIV